MNYGNKDTSLLDASGNYYSRHINRLTSDKMKSTSDIAAELGYRDLLVDRLLNQLNQMGANISSAQDIIFEERGFIPFTPGKHEIEAGAKVDIITCGNMLFGETDYLPESDDYFERFAIMTPEHQMQCFECNEVTHIRIIND